MKRLWGSGSGPAVGAGPVAAEPLASPVRSSAGADRSSAGGDRSAAGGERPGRVAGRRWWRRRRMVIVAPFLVVLLWAIASYTVWMLQPTSMSWDVRSVEWVRQ